MQFNEENKYYVYVWFYKDTNKVFYVGKGTKYRYRSRKRDNKKLVEIINNNDCESRIIFDNLCEEDAFNLEIETIKYYRDNKHPLINIQDGGHVPPSHLGVKRSEETRKKLSEALKKYHNDHPESSEKSSERMKTFLKTEKGRNFMEKSIRARDNDEFRKQQSIRCKIANQKLEYIEKQSEIAKHTWENESYRKAHTGANNCRAQAVKQYDMQGNFIAEYPTLTQASKETNVDFRKISLVAKGKRKSAGGFLWEYVNDKGINQKKSTHVYNVDNDKNAIPILQYKTNGELIAEYKSIAEATRINGFKNRTNIIANLKGKTKSAYGYIWKYKQDNTVPSR